MSYDDLGGGALEAAVRAVGASNVLLYRYDADGVVRGVAGTLAPALPGYTRELFEEDPVQRHLFSLGRPPGVVLTVHAMDRRAYLRSAAYHDFYRPHDMEHLLGMWLTDLPYGAPGMAGILFTRASGQPDFTEQDAGTLARVVPSFQAAARRVERVDRALTERRALGALLSAVAPGARVAFDLGGRPLWISPEAEALLAPALGGGRALPAALVEGAARVGALARGGAIDTPPFTVSVGSPDLAVHAELRLARAASGERMVVATLEAGASAGGHGPSAAVLAVFGEAHGLTRAETAVLGCVAEGLSNRAIAARLFVSVETVKTHMNRLLGKLGVASRTQAAVLVNRAASPR